MSDSPDLPRLYDEKEVSRLLDRATQIQREEPVRAAGAGGLSLRELEEIAVEAGIDPRHLRRAAMELDADDTGAAGWSRFLGTPPTLVVQASVPGAFPANRFEHLIPTIQSTAGVAGQPSLLGHTLTWHAEIGMGRRDRSLNVSISVRDGETNVRAEEQLGPVALAMFAGGMGGMGMALGMGVGMPLGVGLLGSSLLAAAFPVGIVSVAYLGARKLFGRFARRRRRVLVRVVDRLVQQISAAVSSSALEPGEDPTALPPG